MRKTKLKRELQACMAGRFFRLTLFLEGICVGAITGVVIVLFRFLIEQLEFLRERLYNGEIFQGYSTGLMIVLGIIFMMIVLSKVVEKEPMASGSGIPQIKGILLGKMHMHWVSVLFYKFIGGVLAIGSGLSLGREGPSVQLGATIGQGVSRLSRRSRFEERFLLTSGAGAGLAAAFNAPLAGVVFCLEELQKNFSPFVLMATISATVTATVVTQQFFGDQPIFHIDQLAVMPMRYYGLLLIMGAFLAVLGRAFNKMLLWSMDFYDNKFYQYKMLKTAVPLVGAGVLGLFLPQILGGGNSLVDAMVHHHYALSFLLLLFAGKFFFTMLCFGSGVPGGIFLPMLVLGALGGSIFSGVAEAFGWLDPAYAENVVVFAMAGYFAAVVKSPVTGSILIMEMTGSFEHMLALICVSTVAYVAADMMNGKPVYDELLERSLRKQKKIREQIRYRRLLLELTVESASSIDGKQISQISWPRYSMVVNIKRGEMEIIPVADTRIQAGDYLYIFANDKDMPDLFKMVKNLI